MHFIYKEIKTNQATRISLYNANSWKLMKANIFVNISHIYICFVVYEVLLQFALYRMIQILKATFNIQKFTMFIQYLRLHEQN